MPKLRNIILGLTVSIIGGAICAWLKTPLPWMIWPLLAMTACNFSGARLAAPPLGRESKARHWVSIAPISTFPRIRGKE